MTRADYTHSIETHQGRSVIIIEDLNLGNKSVTNDIENVVKDIAVMEKIDPLQHIIVYKDSMGTWDGFDPLRECIVHLGEDKWRHAAGKYIRMQTEKTMATS